MALVFERMYAELKGKLDDNAIEYIGAHLPLVEEGDVELGVLVDREARILVAIRALAEGLYEMAGAREGHATNESERVEARDERILYSLVFNLCQQAVALECIKLFGAPPSPPTVKRHYHVVTEGSPEAQEIAALTGFVEVGPDGAMVFDVDNKPIPLDTVPAVIRDRIMELVAHKKRSRKKKSDPTHVM